MYTIKKTFGPLASGTRVELVDPQKVGFDKIARARHGYVTVRLPQLSRKMREQNHPLIRQIVASPIFAFDIEADNLVRVRNREHVPAHSK